MSEVEGSGGRPVIRLILANISTMSADLLHRALHAEDSISLVGTASTTDELPGLLRRNPPDISLVGTDGSRKGPAAVSFLESTADLAPSVRQIVMSPDMGQEDIVAYFRGGARGLLCGSETDVAVLVKCIRCVSNGQIWANSEQLDRLLRSLAHPRSLKVTNMRGDSILSTREEQVIHLLADGLSNRELAMALKLSEHTVKNHLFHIFDKLGVSNRLEAVLYAMSHKGRHTNVRDFSTTRLPPSPAGVSSDCRRLAP